jgi:dienelactone hydrolase
MAVARIEKQIVLHDQGRDPHIIGGDRRALRAELNEDPGIVMGRLFVSE